MADTMVFSRRRFIYRVAGFAAAGLSPNAFAQTGCRFHPSEPAVRLLIDGGAGRNVRLLERYEFVDSNGRNWPVPSDIIVDGASIPRVFFSLIGGPFDGPYRGPSIIHDYYCERRTRRSSEVHAMFHDAMLCAGVGSRRAFIMFEAVKRFGPSWADPKPRPPQCDIATDDYDFDLCTVNTTPPSVEIPSLGRSDLAKFLDDVRGEADPTDIAVLNSKLREM